MHFFIGSKQTICFYLDHWLNTIVFQMLFIIFINGNVD